MKNPLVWDYSRKVPDSRRKRIRKITFCSTDMKDSGIPDACRKALSIRNYPPYRIRKHWKPTFSWEELE